MYKLLFICLIPLFAISATINDKAEIKDFLESLTRDRDCSKINLEGSFMKFDKREDGSQSYLDYFQLYIFNEEDPLDSNDKKRIQRAVDKSKLELINEIRSDGNKIQIYIEDRNDKIQEIFMLVLGEEKSIIFHAEGEIFYSDLDELDIDFEGADSIKQIKK